MNDYQQRLLNEMLSKLAEAATYNRISGFLTFLWLFEVIYFIFWDQMSNINLYFTIWLVCIVGWTHMSRKFKTCMKEYEELKEEYENTI
jgi:hypothetical protein